MWKKRKIFHIIKIFREINAKVASFVKVRCAFTKFLEKSVKVIFARIIMSNLKEILFLLFQKFRQTAVFIGMFYIFTELLPRLAIMVLGQCENG